MYERGKMFSLAANTQKHKVKQQGAIFYPLECKKLISLMPPSAVVNLWKWKFHELLAGM
jgi:hypothetical protein